MSTGHESLSRWQPVAEKIKHVPARTYPLDWLVKSAGRIGALIERYWKPTENLPGLEQAGPRLHSDLPEEISTLVEALQQARQEIVTMLPQQSDPAGTLQRAVYLLKELQDLIEWAGDLDLETLEYDEADLAELASEPVTVAAMADALRDYAGVTDLLLPRVGDVGGFDPAIVQEAYELADRLDQMERAMVTTPADVKALFDLRERLAHLLRNRLDLVRQAVLYIFRHHDEVTREAAIEEPARQRAIRRRAALLYGRRTGRQLTQRYGSPHPQ